MYKDIEMKLQYHKERIIKELIKKGVFPDNRLVQLRINNIELRLSIFKNPNIKEGSKFDYNGMTESIKMIYEDLHILYKLIYELTIKEYGELSRYVTSHLRELDDMANMYLKRAESESYTTAIGKSLIFKHKNFDIDRTSTNSIVNMGKLKIEDASKIACIINANNVDYQDILFNFNNKNMEEPLTVNAYNYNHDILTIPGESIIKEYAVSVPQSQKISGPLNLPLIVDNIENGSFITLAGKDMIMSKAAGDNGEVILEKPVALNSLSFKEHSYIDFYVIGGSSISFRFNKKPIAANFNINLNRIDNLNYIHHFFIEGESNFSFDFELDKGTVYAIKEKTLIERNRLLYSGQVDIKDFLIIHSLPGEEKEYDVTVELINTSISDEDIESIMIKKI